MRSNNTAIWLGATVVAFGLTISAAACGDETPLSTEGKIGFDPDRPEIGDPDDVEPYTGDNEIVLEAQENYRTGIEFHQKVIWRTCTPNGGVCHNNKEYPDLRTPANFADAFGKACNVQPGEYQSVWDGCERPGDRFEIAGGGFDLSPTELGWIEYIPGEPPEEGYGDGELPPEDAPGLHIHLANPIPGDRTNGYGPGEFSRFFVTDGEILDSVYFTFDTRWWVLPGRTHVIGDVRQYQADTVQELISVGVVMGDHNRNGIFGAREDDPHQLLEPGSPEDSYLVGRLRGIMHQEEIPGSRMPLANQPFSVADMLALYCLIEQFPENGDDTVLTNPIDYKNCSYSVSPESLDLLGAALTWDTRVRELLGQNCWGCHSDVDPQAGLDLKSEGAYDRLVTGYSTQVPDLKFIEPGDPMRSYLYLKIIGDDTIEGKQMPINPLQGENALPQPVIDDIQTWIVNGAVENE